MVYFKDKGSSYKNNYRFETLVLQLHHGYFIDDLFNVCSWLSVRARGWFRLIGDDGDVGGRYAC